MSGFLVREEDCCISKRPLTEPKTPFSRYISQEYTSKTLQSLDPVIFCVSSPWRSEIVIRDENSTRPEIRLCWSYPGLTEGIRNPNAHPILFDSNHSSGWKNEIFRAENIYYISIEIKNVKDYGSFDQECACRVGGLLSGDCCERLRLLLWYTMFELQV